MRNNKGLINKIHDNRGDPIYDFACVDDVKAPYVRAVLTKVKGRKSWVNTESVDWSTSPCCFSQKPVLDSLPNDVFSLKKQLLWKIGLNLASQHPIRVVNYELKQDNGQLLLHKVYFGWKGLVTYLGYQRSCANASYTLDWVKFQPFFHHSKTDFQKMEWFLPADLADMLRELPFSCQLSLIRGLKPLLASYVMTEMEAHYQYPILDKLPSCSIREILSCMPSNHASTILREYKDPEKVIRLLPNPLQESIKQQLRYDPGTAGAWMDTDFFSFSSNSTCQDCLDYLRSHSLPPESIFYIYIENEQREFIGVVSIRSVIMAEPTVKLESLMKKNLVTLTVQTPKVEIANIMSRYHLLALPVVDEEKKIAGVIKIHDVLTSALEYPV